MVKATTTATDGAGGRRSGGRSRGGGRRGALKQLRIVSRDRTNSRDGEEEEGIVVEIRQDNPVECRTKVCQVRRIVYREVGLVQAAQPQLKGCTIQC